MLKQKVVKLEHGQSCLDPFGLGTLDFRHVHPFIKWAGGKGKLLSELNKMIPSRFNTYFEPFLGGGKMFFNLVSKNMITTAYLSDVNKELIIAYKVIKDNPKEVIELLQKYETEYKAYAPLSQEHEDYYYILRDLYNNLVLFINSNYKKQPITSKYEKIVKIKK